MKKDNPPIILTKPSKYEIILVEDSYRKSVVPDSEYLDFMKKVFRLSDVIAKEKLETLRSEGHVVAGVFPTFEIAETKVRSFSEGFYRKYKKEIIGYRKL